jgi:hypothetical protein
LLFEQRNLIPPQLGLVAGCIQVFFSHHALSFFAQALEGKTGLREFTDIGVKLPASHHVLELSFKTGVFSTQLIALLSQRCALCRRHGLLELRLEVTGFSFQGMHLRLD